jgi:hypothetical protein
MGPFLVEEDACVEAVGRAGRVVVGRGFAGWGAGVAGGSGGVGRVAARSCAVGADRGVLGLRGGGGQGERGSRASDDRDRHLCAADGDQAPHGLGLRDAGQGGLGLAASAAFLFDRAGGAGAGGVDGPQAHAPVGWHGGRRSDAVGDRQGGARDAFSGRCGADRLDRCGGSRAPSPGAPASAKPRF